MNKNLSQTPFCDSKTCEGWSGDAAAIDPSEAQKLEKLLNRIAHGVDLLQDSPISLLETMKEFSKNWNNNRENYLG